MKKLKVTDKSKCMGCLECVQACSNAFYKVFDQAKSCIQIIGDVKNSNKPLPKTCIMCGKCARTCQHGAISRNKKGVYVIDKKLCVGCGDCVRACPMQVMVLDTENQKASKCIACGICAKSCPMQILEVVETPEKAPAKKETAAV